MKQVAAYGLVVIAVVLLPGTGPGFSGAESGTQDWLLLEGTGAEWVKIGLGDPSPDHPLGACGGFAPLVSNCTTGTHTIGWISHWEHGFLLPPCGSSLSPTALPVNDVCYIGILESIVTYPEGSSGWTLRCTVIVTPLRTHRYYCEQFGPFPETLVVFHRCHSYLYYPNDVIGNALPFVEGGTGEWRCYFYHSGG